MSKTKILCYILVGETVGKQIRRTDHWEKGLWKTAKPGSGQELGSEGFGGSLSVSVVLEQKPKVRSRWVTLGG